MTKESVVPQTIKLNNAYAPGLIIKGALSQSANLQEWQDSAGAVLSGIGPNGRIFAQGKTGSTDDLLYLRRADNNVYMYVDKDATLRGNFSIALNQNPPIDTQAFIWSGTSTRSAFGVSGTGSTNPTFYAKATASQTSNLTEWQNSAGTVLSSIESGGALNVSPVAAPNGYSIYVIGAGSSGIVTMKSTATSAHAIQLQNSANTIVFKMDQEGRIVPAATTSVGLTVRGAASQTANLQEWQNSSGTVLSRVISAGWAFFERTNSDIFQNVAQNSSYLQLFSNGSIKATSSGTTQVPFAVKGFVAQTANLQEWQDSAGATQLSVSATGDLISVGSRSVRFAYHQNVGGTGSYIDFGQTANTLSIIQRVTTAVGLIVKGVASQTADLQQWQDSAGNAMLQVASNGTVTSYGTIGIWSGRLSDAQLSINTAYYTNSGIVVRGAASQTANLQEWQNSAGTVLSGINPAGQIFAGTTASINGSTTHVVTGRTYVSSTVATFQYDGTNLVQVGQKVTLSGFIYGEVDYNGTWPVTEVTSNSFTVLGSGFPNTFFGGGRFTVSSPGSFVANTALTTPIVVRGVASQTANLQEWQNSTGSPLLRINSAGQIQALQSSGLVVKASPTLTATITNASGDGTLVFYTAENTFTPGQIVTITGVSPAAYNLSSVQVNTAHPTYFSVNNAATGTYVSGGTATVAQIANLQEWQNSAGTILPSIAPNGTLTLKSINSANIATFFNGSSGFGAGNISYNGIFNINAANMGFPYNSSGATLSVNATSATIVPITSRGFASQTGDLQQWQNSAGTVLSKIESTGAANFVRAGIGGATPGTTALFVTAPSATAIPVLVRAAASQTASLQEWQITDGTVRSFINPLGRVGVRLSSLAVGTESLSVGTVNTTDIGIVVRSAASQTANLQEWQNSAGTVLAKIAADGAVSLASGGVDIHGAGANFTIRNAGTTAWYTNSSLLVGTGYSAGIGVIIRGNGSQTADLQQWQNSAGTTLSAIDNSGNFTKGDGDQLVLAGQIFG